jgi:hypothetical protein
VLYCNGEEQFKPDWLVGLDVYALAAINFAFLGAASEPWLRQAQPERFGANPTHPTSQAIRTRPSAL